MPFSEKNYPLKSNYNRVYKPSNINLIYADLIAILDNDKRDNFSSKLQEHFRCKKLHSLVDEEGNSESELWSVRPVIEELFFSNIELFIGLVKKTLEINDDMVYYTLHNAIPNNIKAFAWNHEICAEIATEVSKFITYSNKQDSKNTKKNIVKNLANKLNSKLENQPQIITTSKDVGNFWSKKISVNMPNKDYFTVLLYKLELLVLLHSQDKALAVHRGWKRFTLNFCTILFSVGIANAINYFTTGNFLFFNQTRTQEYTMDIHDAIGLELGPEKIKVKTPLKSILIESTLPEALADIVLGYYY